MVYMRKMFLYQWREGVGFKYNVYRIYYFCMEVIYVYSEVRVVYVLYVRMYFMYCYMRFIMCTDCSGI